MRIIVSATHNMTSFLFPFVNGLGKTSNVGGCFPQESGATRPSFQYHTPESQEVSNLEPRCIGLGSCCRVREKITFKMYSFQILPACDHLEYQGRSLGWEEHHRRGNERHLCQRVRFARAFDKCRQWNRLSPSLVFITEGVHYRLLGYWILFYLINALCAGSSWETKGERTERKEKSVWLLFMSRGS